MHVRPRRLAAMDMISVLKLCPRRGRGEAGAVWTFPRLRSLIEIDEKRSVICVEISGPQNERRSCQCTKQLELRGTSSYFCCYAPTPLHTLLTPTDSQITPFKTWSHNLFTPLAREYRHIATSKRSFTSLRPTSLISRHNSFRLSI